MNASLETKAGGELSSGLTHQRIHMPQIQTFLCPRTASAEVREVGWSKDLG